jgi:3-phenylpropionate/trans-cinnamate dioxygenase ferredoxin component
MNMIQVAKVTDITPGSMKSFNVGDKKILVANVGGKFFAINDLCTHAKGDLSKGKLEDKIITCPRHGSKFDVSTGICLSGPKIALSKPKNEETYEVQIEGDSIKIKVN